MNPLINPTKSVLLMVKLMVNNMYKQVQNLVSVCLQTCFFSTCLFIFDSILHRDCSWLLGKCCVSSLFRMFSWAAFASGDVALSLSMTSLYFNI